MNKNLCGPSVPNNVLIEERLKNGEDPHSIFDECSYVFRQEHKPMRVKLGELYNFVFDRHLLFNEWFSYCQEFENEYPMTLAYRNCESGNCRKPILIKSDGTYPNVKFDDICFDILSKHYAIIKQANGLCNIYDTVTQQVWDPIGIEADYISINDRASRDAIFILARGKSLNIHSTIAPNTKGIKYNFYTKEKGILSPNEWFDLVVPFMTSRDMLRKACRFAVVYKGNKANFLDREGKLLSNIWFDIAATFGDLTGQAGILRGPSYSSLADFIENYDFNPQKYVLYNIDRNGNISLAK